MTEQRGYLVQIQVDEESTATQDGEQAEGPSRHELETATHNAEEASSTGRVVGVSEAERATSRSTTCRVEKWTPPV